MPAAGGDTESGKYGKVMVGATPILEITGWSLSIKHTSEKYASSATNGWKTARQGVLDSSGSFTYKMDITAAEAIHNVLPFDDSDGKGLEMDLILYIDATNYYTVPAIVDFSVDVDINDGAPTGGTANFEGTGPVVPSW
jgi:hypothetical protein